MIAAFLALAVSASPIWSSVVYPETLAAETRQLAQYRDLARRNGAGLTVLNHGKALRTFTSLDTCSNHVCRTWLFQGVVNIGGNTLAVVRLETGHGGHDAIVRADGRLLWTEGFPVGSPDGRWLAVSGDVADQMETIKTHDDLRLIDWQTSRAILIRRSCVVDHWISAIDIAVYCLDHDTDETLHQDARGRWHLTVR